MRYRIGETGQQVGPPASGEMLVFAVVLGLMIGIILFGLGLRGRMMWLSVWGGGLALISVTYLITFSLGII
jgi:hypothetical protein